MSEAMTPGGASGSARGRIGPRMAVSGLFFVNGLMIGS